MKEKFYDEKSRRNNLYRKTTYGVYSIPAQFLNKTDEKEFVASIKRDVFHKIGKYGNVVETQPINKRISTCINYEAINLEK